jgi:adenosine deaminase
MAAAQRRKENVAKVQRLKNNVKVEEVSLFQDETTPLNRYFSLPKVELHRHLEGSLRLSTMLDIAQKHGVTIPISMLNLSGLVQVQDQDPMTFTNFLDKFKTLRLFYRSPDVIHRVAREAVEDAAKDNCRYMELRFTPVALSRAE